MKSLFEGAERFEAQLSLSLTKIMLLLFSGVGGGGCRFLVVLKCCGKNYTSLVLVHEVTFCGRRMVSGTVVSFINTNHSLLLLFSGGGVGKHIFNCFRIVWNPCFENIYSL